MKIKRFFLVAVALCWSSYAFSQCETDFSVYREYYKQWKDNKFNPKSINPQMISSWRHVLLNCPSFKQYTYLDGANIVAYAFINTTKDPDLRNKYVDTLIMVYDNRAKYFPKDKNGSQVGNIMGRKGLDLIKWAPDRYEEAYQALKQALELDGENANSAFMDSYFQMTITMAKNGKLDEAVILDEYSRLMDLVDNNIRKYTDADNEKEVNNFKGVKANLDAAVEPYANCEDLCRIYQPKFEADPNNVELLTKITTMLESKKCDNSKLFLDASINLHKLNPSPESAYLISKKFLSEKDYSSAKKYLLEATKSENMNIAHNAYKYLAQIALADKDFSRGRDYARRAISLDNTDGSPYITIGQLYAASAKECGTGDFYSKTAFWCAVDQFQKAKSVDPSIAATANELIAYYQSVFPTVEAIFFNGFEEGQDFTVECWINETTKIRAAK